MDTLIHYFSINSIFVTIGTYEMSYLEFFWTISNIICVYLASRNNIWNRPIWLIWVILYIFLFYQIQLYADLWEQFYFFITGIYGRYAWSVYWKQQNNKSDIWFLTAQYRWLYSIGIGICTALLIWIIAHLNVRFPKFFPEPASYVVLDSFTTILSFAATILMIRKKVECWILRIIVDIIGIYLYYVKGVQFIALEYVLFLWLAINGLFQRRKNAKKTSNLSTL